MKGIYCGSILFAQKKVIDQIRKKWWAKANQLLRLEEGVLLEKRSKPENESKMISDVWNHLFMCMDKAGHCKEKLLLMMNGAMNIEKKLAEDS
ncbi:hypothetical protein JHK85_000874 [Glycine max]|nr:hypothetical protein JHK85_000874 [Glycine max]